ncbi:MAG: sensor histidine kinase N-terminal domain-containing protein [Methylobacteriaceae bacterium]|jgi:signal transduction histidine kinase|nr:sensor histidine kinase N-terminal domain-containing protein [Methylobacteriaceae bacterium]
MLLKNRSIAVRLAAASLLWSAVILVDAAAVLYHLESRSTEQIFDRRLETYAETVVTLVDVYPEDAGLVGSIGHILFDLPQSGWYWEISRDGGRVEDNLRSNSLGDAHLILPPDWGVDTRDENARVSVRGYGTAPDGERVRIIEADVQFRVRDNGFYRVYVAGPASEITIVSNRFLYMLIATFSLLGLGWVITTFVQIRYGLKPLNDLRAALSLVRAGRTERIEGRFPEDIAPLAKEINLLLETNREILERARTQVGNLAHALKTPLSVMSNEIEDMDPETAKRIREQTEIMKDQVQYHVNRARAAALAGTLGTYNSVNDVADALLRTFRKIYPEGVPEITGDVSRNLVFFGESQDLQEMLGNLIDNACKWAKSKVRLSATLKKGEERAFIRLSVEDDGPGIEKDNINTAVQRGKKLDETQPGTGLGLSIVADLSSLYRGSLAFEKSPLGGVRVVLELPGEQRIMPTPPQTAM